MKTVFSMRGVTSPLRQAQCGAWLSILIGVSGRPSPAGRGYGVDFCSLSRKCIASSLRGRREKGFVTNPFLCAVAWVCPLQRTMPLRENNMLMRVASRHCEIVNEKTTVREVLTTSGSLL